MIYEEIKLKPINGRNQRYSSIIYYCLSKISLQKQDKERRCKDQKYDFSEVIISQFCVNLFKKFKCTIQIIISFFSWFFTFRISKPYFFGDGLQ